MEGREDAIAIMLGRIVDESGVMNGGESEAKREAVPDNGGVWRCLGYCERALMQEGQARVTT